MINSEIWAPAFFKHNNSFISIVAHYIRYIQKFPIKKKSSMCRPKICSLSQLAFNWSLNNVSMVIQFKMTFPPPNLLNSSILVRPNLYLYEWSHIVMFANKFLELTCFLISTLYIPMYMNPHGMQGNLIWVSDFFDILPNGAVEVF